MSKSVERPDNVTRKAQQGCAEWLCSCLRLGWPKPSLDDLENIWWQYHDRTGKLNSDREPP